MMKCILCVCLITISLGLIAAVPRNEVCESCVPQEECVMFQNMNAHQQQKWIQEYTCNNGSTRKASVQGFSSVAKGDNVCCSNSIWGMEESVPETSKQPDLDVANQKITLNSRNGEDHGIPFNYDQPGPNVRPNTGNNNKNYRQIRPDNRNPNPRNINTYPETRGNMDAHNNWLPDSPNNYNYPTGNSGNRRGNNGYGAYDSNQTPNPYGANNPVGVRTVPPRNYNPSINQNPYYSGNGRDNGNSIGNIDSRGLCTGLTSFPPALETGCCGREASDLDRITGNQNSNINRPHTPSFNQNNWPRRDNRYQGPRRNNNWPLRMLKDTDPEYEQSIQQLAGEEVNITVDSRIIGGQVTELYQFPWTVLLKVTFDYGDKQAAFSCGGSLISSRYVLTAGHCVYDEGGTVIDTELYLAEYDKRTYPKDCKKILGEGQKCIENVVLYAEDIIRHPQYDDERLINDIALIRIRGKAPYTDYIRPICLPPIDIDNPTYSNIRLAVAGWGRNGAAKSDIKQSTVVNLVAHQDCKKSYPTLSTRHLCAAGYTGEDTCKGDSGGPLMAVYKGRYFVAGVVSGKRADSPCGTSVPSLYTNVYHYLDWIRSSIKQ